MRLNFFHLTVSVTLTFACACSTAPYPFPFKDLHPNQKIALEAYLKGSSCASGAKFGSIAQRLGFVTPKLEAVEAAMKEHDCKKKVVALQDLKHKPLLDSKGGMIPLWEWICPEGTVVRVKPQGDPTNKFDTRPLGSVALHFPCDSPYESFDDELLKVDSAGNPIPKWARELDSSDAKVIETWAHAAHFLVVVPEKTSK